jgi:hypothetical protein
MTSNVRFLAKTGRGRQVLTGQTIARSHWNARTRAHYAAHWLQGELDYRPTVSQAAFVMGCSTAYVRDALVNLEAERTAAAPLTDADRIHLARTLSEQGAGQILELATV